jgi:hypothetical protein
MNIISANSPRCLLVALLETPAASPERVAPTPLPALRAAAGCIAFDFDFDLAFGLDPDPTPELTCFPTLVLTFIPTAHFSHCSDDPGLPTNTNGAGQKAYAVAFLTLYIQNIKPEVVIGTFCQTYISL